MRKRVLVSWSTGKDSAWALYVLQQDPNIEVVGGLGNTNANFKILTFTKSVFLNSNLQKTGPFISGMASMNRM